jgi:hypothetical protein
LIVVVLPIPTGSLAAGTVVGLEITKTGVPEMKAVLKVMLAASVANKDTVA